jgi:hypothetical protein
MSPRWVVARRPPKRVHQDTSEATGSIGARPAVRTRVAPCSSVYRLLAALRPAARIGALKPVVFKVPNKFTAMRQAMRPHQTAIQDVVRAKLRLKAVVLSRGLTPQADLYQLGSRAKWLKQLPMAHRQLAPHREA